VAADSAAPERRTPGDLRRKTDVFIWQGHQRHGRTSDGLGSAQKRPARVKRIGRTHAAPGAAK